jgi:hypothetical protein
MVLHNPELAYKRFSFQQSEQLSGQPQEFSNALDGRPKNNYAMIIFRRVSTYIREVEVKRKQSTRFFSADLSHVRINAASHALLRNRHCVMLILSKQGLDFEGQVLVDLKPHQLAAGRGTTRSRASSAAYSRAA